MSRYIKFEDAVKVMACEMYAEAQSQGFDVDSVEDFIPEAKAWLNDAPTIDAVEVVRGEWKEREVLEDTVINEWQSARCSECGKYHTTPYMYYFDNFKFCPNCGADMREREGE